MTSIALGLEQIIFEFSVVYPIQLNTKSFSWIGIRTKVVLKGIRF